MSTPISHDAAGRRDGFLPPQRLAYTHILNGGKKKRYDFVYCNKAWKIVSSKVYYEDAIEAGSDHGMVVTDVVI